MQHELESFIGAAAADELPARMRDSAPDGQVSGEVAMQSLELPPMVTGAGGEAATRLEKRTHLDEPQANYKIQLINYGDGLGEIGWSFVSSKKPPKAGRGNSDNREKNEDRAVRRARSRLRRLILSARADHLLTLTYRDNVTDFEQASSDLNKFVRIVKTKVPDWIYIAVAEQQKRGAWHWHLAVRGRQNVEFLRESWRHVVGEGNIDVNPPKGKGKNRLLALVKYLGKYLAKGFQDGNRELNARRFRASLGISIPVTTIPLPREQRNNASGYAVQMLKANVGEVGFVWLAEDHSAGWACSWR
jgi:hypothetical protein